MSCRVKKNSRERSRQDFDVESISIISNLIKTFRSEEED